MEKIKNIYKQGELLSKVNNPEDLRKLKTSELPQLAKELRQYIIDIVSEIVQVRQNWAIGVSICKQYITNCNPMIIQLKSLRSQDRGS